MAATKSAPSVKVAKKGMKSTKGVSKDQKRKRARKETYSVYIHRVLKQVNLL